MEVLYNGQDYYYPKYHDNKYLINPLSPGEEGQVIIRSSADGSPPLGREFDYARREFEELRRGNVSVEELTDILREDISNIFSLPEGTGIIFTPSDTSAQLIPMLFAKWFYKAGAPTSQQRFTHIVTSKGKMNRETKWAAGGSGLIQNMHLKELTNRDNQQSHEREID